MQSRALYLSGREQIWHDNLTFILKVNVHKGHCSSLLTFLFSLRFKKQGPNRDPSCGFDLYMWFMCTKNGKGDRNLCSESPFADSGESDWMDFRQNCESDHGKVHQAVKERLFYDTLDAIIHDSHLKRLLTWVKPGEEAVELQSEWVTLLPDLDGLHYSRVTQLSGDQLYIKQPWLLRLDANNNQVTGSYSMTNSKQTNNPLTANTLCNFQVYLQVVWLDASYKIRVTPVTENE